MSVAYFIVLNNPDPGFDPFVNGKFLAQNSRGLARIATRLGLRGLDDFVSLDADDVDSMAEELDAPEDITLSAAQWYDADEGLTWVAQLRTHVEANPQQVRNPAGVLADLHEFEQVFTQAKAIGARWHLAMDY